MRKRKGKLWYKAKVLKGKEECFNTGDTVYVTKTSPVGPQEYCLVWNPQTGYETASTGGWRIERFCLALHELDHILGLRKRPKKNETT